MKLVSRYHFQAAIENLSALLRAYFTEAVPGVLIDLLKSICHNALTRLSLVKHGDISGWFSV